MITKLLTGLINTLDLESGTVHLNIRVTHARFITLDLQETKLSQRYDLKGDIIELLDDQGESIKYTISPFKSNQHYRQSLVINIEIM